MTIFPPPIITIDRTGFHLRLWKKGLSRYFPKKSYSIAVGMEGHETPTGMYFVQSKTRRPDWLAPHSDWVVPPKVPGTVYKFDDPLNPFAGGFISVSQKEGIGIHGTKFDPQLGHDVSHGCIRMAVSDLEDLYGRVPVGSPVFIY